jgi:hypothetical protein
MYALYSASNLKAASARLENKYNFLHTARTAFIYIPYWRSHYSLHAPYKHDGARLRWSDAATLEKTMYILYIIVAKLMLCSVLLITIINGCGWSNNVTVCLCARQTVTSRQ